MSLDTIQDYAMRILTNGMVVSALIGLSVFIMGMIIVHFTPDDDRDQKRKPSK